MTKGMVLVVDDDAQLREALRQTLDLADLEVRLAGSFVEAKDQFSKSFPGIVLSDIRMPGRDGFHLLDYCQSVDADLPVILLTGEGDIPMAVRAMGQGAFGFLEKPCAAADLIAVIERALKTRALVLENRRLKAQLETGDPAARMLFGTSPQASELRARVRAVAQMRSDVLVSGPPGSGVSKVAEVIHLTSAQAKGPFVKRAAAGMRREEVEEALELARGGTIFLDELGLLPPEAQFAVLEHIEPEAGAPTRARLIAGTNSDLRPAVEAGGFNADLFYRLDVMRVRIPALAERPGDIPVLFHHYVAQASEQAGLRPPEITPQVIAGLMAQEWPGNARALMSVAMRFALGLGGADTDPKAEQVLGLNEQLAQVGRSLLAEALRRAGGRAQEAATQLKLPRKTFYDKLARYGLRPEEFR